MKFFLIGLFLFTSSQQALSKEYMAFKVNNPREYASQLDTKIINLGRTRTQDSIGVCYAFTTAKLLERVCNVSKNCNLNGEEISPLYLAKMFRGSIIAGSGGGHLDGILENLNHSPRKRIKVLKESCIPYDQTVYRRYTGNGTYFESPQEGITYLKNFYESEKNKAQHNCTDCISTSAKKLKKELPGLNASLQDIESILSSLRSYTYEEFIDELLTDNQCDENNGMIEIPKFKRKYKVRSDFKDENALVNKLVEKVNEGIPAYLSVCVGKTNRSSGKRECGSHGVIVNGSRRVCKESVCRTELRVQNSWGRSWEESHNDGWVDGKTLAKLALNEPTGNGDELKKGQGEIIIVNWLEPMEELARTNQRSSQLPSRRKVDNTKANKRSNSQENKSELKKGSFYQCTKTGATPYFGDDYRQARQYQSQGYNCKIMY